MWEPRCLTTLWDSTACYRDSFTFFLQLIWLMTILTIPVISLDQYKTIEILSICGTGHCFAATYINRFKSMTNRTVWISEYTRQNRWHTCINVTISTLLKKIKLDNVDSMLSSNTDGVGNTTSWMYCTRYVWWIFARSSGLEMGMTSLNLKQNKFH
jgi:hypothetical protein